MAKARRILKHANAIKNIRTITRTMEMVAAARFKRTHDLAASARPYTDHLAGMVADIVERLPREKLTHPLMIEPEGVNTLVMLVITSNRGLCGSFNTGVLRLVIERMEQLKESGYKVRLHVIGKRGIQFFRFRRIEVAREYRDFTDMPDYRDIRDASTELMDMYLDGEISDLEIGYMQFISVGRQSPSIAQILPMSDLPSVTQTIPGQDTLPYDFHPSPEQLFEKLLPVAVIQKIYQCFMDAAVSEQVMRIAAMHGATESADEMIQKMTVKYNRVRQSQITTELSEIMGGRMGLE
ncbi:MAG: ATP synthase F1 subunit gamma [Phycisphaerales bacterium]|nr:ATP synthase F1 subunit gamma [Phycisphaerales bacterium]